jgi:hypothetical protein
MVSLLKKPQIAVQENHNEGQIMAERKAKRGYFR